jgi:hypothetical protein
MDLKAHKDERGRWTLEGVEPSEVTFKRMCLWIDEHINFKFARYGDGEFMCMAGVFGANKDKHEYFPDLGQALNDAFYSDPKYLVGIQPLSVQGGLYQKALEFGPGPKHIKDADVLHSASIDGKLGKFFKVLDTRRTVLVGPEYLGPMDFDIHVFIPELNCWRNHEGILHRLKREIRFDDVVILCASMMSEVIIHELQNEHITIIDAGSVFDPYVNKFSRSYHYKKEKWILN